jgi:hypothetical protein
MANSVSRRTYFGLGWYVCLTALAAAMGLSFAMHAINFVLVMGAVMGGGALALLVFRIRPKFVGIAVGSLAVGCWSLLALGFGALALFGESSPLEVTLDDGQVCRESVYGFAAGDSGEILDIYKRYVLIDYRLYHQVHSEVYPDTAPAVPEKLLDVVPECQTRINKARSAGA